MVIGADCCEANIVALGADSRGEYGRSGAIINADNKGEGQESSRVSGAKGACMLTGRGAGTIGFKGAWVLIGADCTDAGTVGIVADGSGEYGRSGAIVSAETIAGTNGFGKVGFAASAPGPGFGCGFVACVVNAPDCVGNGASGTVADGKAE